MTPIFSYLSDTNKILLGTSTSLEAVFFVMLLLLLIVLFIGYSIKFKTKKSYINSGFRDDGDSSILPQFTTGVTKLSQELKIPLMLMMDPLSSISDSEHISKSEKKILDKVKSRCQEMLNKINRASTEEASKLESKNDTINLFAFFRETIYSFESFASSRSINLIFQYQASKDLHISINKLYLHSIVSNLVYNAIKYSKTNGVVNIVVNDLQNCIEFSVQDFGLGILEEDIPFIFNKNFRGRNAISNNTNGVGVGLYVVRNYLNAIAGTITVRSKQNEESIFTVKIPRLEVVTTGIGHIDNLVEDRELKTDVINSIDSNHDEGYKNGRLGRLDHNNSNVIDISQSKSESILQENTSTVKPTVNNNKRKRSTVDELWLADLDKDVDENLSSLQYGVEALADNMGVSRTQLFRKLKALTSLSPNHYIREKKLLVAKGHLENQRFKTVKEVALSVGVSKTSYFAKLYYDRFGVKASSYF